MAEKSVIVQWARHRGRLMTTGDDPQYARSVLKALGFGPHIATWRNPASLPQDWPITDRAWRDNPPYFKTYFFEADWTGPATGVPMRNPNPPSVPSLLLGEDDWYFDGVSVYCWPDQRFSVPPMGFKWCPGMEPPPKPPEPPKPKPPEPPGPEPQPDRPDNSQRSSSAWLMLLGAMAVAVPLGVLIIRSQATPPTRSGSTVGKGATRERAAGRRSRSS